MKEIKLGVIELHTSKNDGLIKDFYTTVKDLRDASCIVDLWMMDIKTILGRHGYRMQVFKLEEDDLLENDEQFCTQTPENPSKVTLEKNHR